VTVVHAGRQGGAEAGVVRRRERRTRLVMLMALLTMVAEIAIGAWTGSLALLADGWHMATHVGALGLASLAYWYARRATRAGRFAFGPGKVATLAGYTNAVALGIVAVLMLVEASERLGTPAPVHFGDALPVAVLGLVVNLLSAWLLQPEHADDHHDHGLKSAYLHVLADAFTSLLAIAALLIGYLSGTARLDALAAGVGSVVILWWAVGLLRSSVPELIDIRLDAEPVLVSLRERLEADGRTSVKEIKLWPLGSGRRGCHLCLVTSGQRPVEDYRLLVLGLASIDHVTVEVHRDDADAIRTA
jgi:cation diffusion facilitator family transporter